MHYTTLRGSFFKIFVKQMSERIKSLITVNYVYNEVLGTSFDFNVHCCIVYNEVPQN